MIGVLALQGNFSAHVDRLNELGAETLLVNRKEQLSEISGLVIPGGESSVFLKLCALDFREEIKRLAEKGLPILATCAGLILLAKKVENPAQAALGLIDVDVKRNAYGRQAESFIAPHLELTAEGCSRLQISAEKDLEGVFIRAPRITRLGPGVIVLARYNDEPVLVQDSKLLAASFHPELSTPPSLVHQYFLHLQNQEPPK